MTVLRSVLAIDCSDEVEGIAAACVVLGLAAETLALDETTARAVAHVLSVLNELPAAWSKEIATQTIYASEAQNLQRIAS